MGELRLPHHKGDGMAKTIEIYPKVVFEVTVPDDFDPSTFQWPKTVVQGVKNRIENIANNFPGATIISWHYHHDDEGGATDE